MPTTIAVGLDGSDSSLLALRWALQTRTAGAARIIAVIAKPFVAKGQTPESARISAARADEHEQDVRAAIQRVAPHEELEIQTHEGSPAEVLLRVSNLVDLLVIGRHAYNSWRDVVTPSLSRQLAVRTAAALCVVKSIPDPPRGLVVVGHDGPASDVAARFAARLADRRGAALMVVTTWRYPFDTRATSAEASGLLEGGATAEQAVIVEDLRRSYPAVRIDTTVRLGNPVEVLVELGDEADLVVVGSHRHGLRHSGLARLVIGSVAVALLRKLSVPVVVVPHD